MPFKVEPVPYPKKTRVNMSEATEDDRLVIVLDNGRQLVFKANPPFPLIECDLELSSPELVEAMARAVWEKRTKIRWAWPFRTPELTLEEIRSDLWVLLTVGEKFPEVTVGYKVQVRAQSSGLSDNYFEVPGGAVKSITATTAAEVPSAQ